VNRWSGWLTISAMDMQQIWRNTQLLHGFMRSTNCFFGAYYRGIDERTHLWYRQVEVRLDVNRDVRRSQTFGYELRFRYSPGITAEFMVGWQMPQVAIAKHLLDKDTVQDIF